MTKPTPTTIATDLRRIADLLDNHGRRAIDLASALAVRGMPSTTSGTGSRSADTTSSTERAAGVDQDQPTINRWADIDIKLHRFLDLMWRVGRDTEHTLNAILAHASDIDPLPAGTGNCVCCGNFVRPDHKHPEQRLRSGFCPACHQAWLRYRTTNRDSDRTKFIHTRRQELLARAEERERRNTITA